MNSGQGLQRTFLQEVQSEPGQPAIPALTW
jgi:hypothetical protein